MKKAYTYFIRDWVKTSMLFPFLALVQVAHAQEGSHGNTTIFGGAQMTFFAHHNFITGSSGTQPGVILTERAAGNFGILNFSGTNLFSTNASDAGYVDGYVRKYGSGNFIFPVGDNGKLGQFAASADGTMGAYFHTDPNTAATSNLYTGSNYAPLPSGGPFNTIEIGQNVAVVSTVEYWDIDGTNASPITLTWDATSAIATLTNNQLNKLAIAGWNGTQWVAIGSEVDATSILSGTSDLTAGSITTSAAIVPNTYTAYTFASLITPLPVKLISFKVTTEGHTAQLNWSTASETNSDRFEVERSFDGKNWQKIGTVKALGKSTDLHNYYHEDPSPANLQNLYRLKMIDQDETYTYSRIRTIKFDSNDADLSIYPNPSSDKLNIRDYSNVKEMVINDLSGRTVYQSGALSQHGTVDIKNLAQGIYIIKLTRLNGELSIHKVVINK